jgi:hypothetical protein
MKQENNFRELFNINDKSAEKKTKKDREKQKKKSKDRVEK